MSVFQSTVTFRELRGIENMYFPTFYRKLLEEWLNLQDRNPEHDMSNSAQVFWNNDKIRYRNNVLFCTRWIDHGLVLVSDIVSATGHIKFGELVDVLGDSTLTQFELNSVQNATRYNLEMQQICTDKEFTVYLRQMPLRSLSSKTVRKILTNENSNIVQNVWSQKYGVVASSKEAWGLAKKVCSETRIICLQWKILHNIYGTQIILNKMGKADSPNCSTCMVPDTVEHFFFHCKLVQDLWEEVKKQLQLILNMSVKLAEQDVILGLLDREMIQQEPIYRQVNQIILIAKLCISKYKYGTHPNLLAIFDNETCLRQIESKP